MEYGLIGEHLSHSFSKIIHEKLGYAYELQELAPSELFEFMRRREFRGINVTIPYKRDAMELCDELSPDAQRIGCVNTVVNKNGRLYGDNTDIYGLMHMMNGASFDGAEVLVLGTGGASLTAREAALRAGAASVVCVSRSGPVDYNNVYEHADAAAIINATPAGMYPHNGTKTIELDRFKNIKFVFDLVYNPLKTALLLEAERLGIKCSGGLPMLTAQAVRASELFTGKRYPAETVDKLTHELMRKMTNIVLTGMPGSGKSSIGMLVAQTMGRDFYDLDEEIVKLTKKSIPEIFAEGGEEHFREIESRVCADIGAKTGVVIATGGGCVLRSENVDALRQNGRVYLLRRDINDLPTDGRPLSTDMERLIKMQAEREPFYRCAADTEIENDANINTAAARIMAYHSSAFAANV